MKLHTLYKLYRNHSHTHERYLVRVFLQHKRSPPIVMTFLSVAYNKSISGHRQNTTDYTSCVSNHRTK